jgi:prepilin-type processing-associated H-X9-DG protein
LNDQTSGRLDPVEVADWYLDTFGMKEHGWICPNAPYRPERPNPVSVGMGTVDQAWQIRDFEPYRELFLDVPADRIVPRATGRVGSYALNLHVFTSGRSFAQVQAFMNPTFPFRSFRVETRVQRPELTPVFGENTHAGDYPNPDEDLGAPPTWAFDVMPAPILSGLGYWALSRHGNRPARLPSQWPAGQRMRGAANIAFFDGHVAAVQLESLWELYWYYDCNPPGRRRGIK